MKKVLWVSRHEMTAEQRADLDRVMGGAELLPWKETVTDVAQLLPLLEQADAVAAVLPPELLAKLLTLAGNKPVLRAVSERRATAAFAHCRMGGASRSSPTSTPAGSSCCAWMCAPGGCDRPTIVENARHENSVRCVSFEKVLFRCPEMRSFDDDFLLEPNI